MAFEWCIERLGHVIVQTIIYRSPLNIWLQNWNDKCRLTYWGTRFEHNTYFAIITYINSSPKKKKFIIMFLTLTRNGGTRFEFYPNAVYHQLDWEYFKTVYEVQTYYDLNIILCLFTDVDECSTNNPCQNGGNCTNTIGSYSCICTSAWSGANCTAGK
jgi:hypothetical protein